MTIKRPLLTLGALITGLVIATSPLTVPQAAQAAYSKTSFIMGGDLGMLHEIETRGGVFKKDGVADDPVEILADSGMNLARLRLWVDPYTASGQAYGGGTNDLATTIAMAQRAKAEGMGILLDFHLSDWWADPGTQTIPKAWRGLTYAQLKTAVHDYTNDVIDQMRAAGVVPNIVQMGNEISSGVLWDFGRIGNGVSDFTQLAGLLTAGITGVKDAQLTGEKIEIALHLDQGGDNALYRWWFDGVTAKNVPFDIIALSYYPFWHGTMGQLAYNLNDLSARYGKDVLIVETAYGWTLGDGDGLINSFYTTEEAAGGYPATVAGQTAFLRDLRDIVKAVPNNRGRGLIWWEPTWLPVPGANWGSEAGKTDNGDTGILSNPWDNQTLFDWNGEALDTLDVFGETAPTNLVKNGGFESNGYTSTPSNWGVWAQVAADKDAVSTQSPAVVGTYKLNFWKATAYTASVYQTKTSLPSGTYRLSAWVLNSGGQNSAYLYAKRYGGTEKQAAFPVSATDWKRVSIDVQVTSGILEFGVYTNAKAGNWLNIDDVRLVRTGP
ncbi:arabinogalactan endo-beta-1,4-galactanase [Microbacterium sp.]|uniref:glycoside hydrolase family 53 protein n=1 Tax=Microbacterium sp. TaxID=51671 RepID=UPI0039E372CB